MLRRFLWPLAIALLGCDGADTADQAVDAAVDAAEMEMDQDGDAATLGPRALVHNALWSEVGRDQDPFATDPPVRCLPDSYGDEVLGGELVVFVRTDSCPSVTLRQASREDVAEGDRVSVRAFHFPLSAPEPGVASLVLQLGESEVFRAQIPIPSDQNELNYEWTAPQDYPRGTPLWFHVENHGANEYALIEVSVGPPEPAEMGNPP